jgi:mitogen-activated protein kinase kinase kinase
VKSKSLVSFILQNGSTVKINVSGCFNASSIKKKLIKFLGLAQPSEGFETYLSDPRGDIHSLFDVELVTICHSVDRIEKNRILFCPKGEYPSAVAIEVSQRLISQEPKQLAVRHDKFRSIFGQRPSSQLISTNISQYFPESKQLEKTIRNSVRYSMRISNKRKSTIGDFIIDSTTKKERARFSIDSLNLESSMDQNKQRFSISTLESDRTSTIQLLDTDSDSDHEEPMGPSFSEASFNWLKGARIGSGSFGTVYLGMNSMTGELMAVKQVELNPLFDNEKDPQTHAKIVESFQLEMNLLSELHHENIVSYLGSNSDDTHINIFLEYVPGGSLNSMLMNYGPFEEPLIRNFTRQILIGLNYLHSRNIIHRDIKGANILIDIKGEVKISDFGISKKLSTSSSNNNKRASLQGSVYWMAPEVVKQIATTTKCDIWSVGCLLIEMFTGKHPFPNFSQMQAIFKIGTHTTPDIPQWCTDQARDFLNQTFILDYKQRPGADKLLEHDFLESLIIK